MIFTFGDLIGPKELLFYKTVTDDIFQLKPECISKGEKKHDAKLMLIVMTIVLHIAVYEIHNSTGIVNFL